MKSVCKVLVSACFVSCAAYPVAQADVFFAPTTIPQTPFAAGIIQEDAAVQHHILHRHWHSMSPEQRAEMRNKMHEHWLSMSPEERLERHREMRAHWRAMSPEQRDRRRAQMHERFNNMSQEQRAQFRRDMGASGDASSPTFIPTVSER